MKSRFTLIIALLITTISLAQNGINYKAIVKDGNGNILASSPITIQFIIYEGVALTNNVYQESHTANTDANGLVIVNIGEGATSNTFADINWDDDDHYLNVQVNTGTGLVDLGTTQFKTVPYALSAGNVSGLEAIDEGNGIGWRLKGRDQANHGNIGENAVDLSYSSSNSTSYGASGFRSTAIGDRTIASGQQSTAMGRITIASGFRSLAMGDSTTSSGVVSTAMGSGTTASGNLSTTMGYLTEASGNSSTAIGRNTVATSYVSMVMGRYNVGGGNSVSWISTDPLFEIGNGTSSSNKRNALTVLKSGTTTLNSSVNADPDLILGGTADTGAGDDGIISSDPNYDGSDIFLRSNDAVIVELDYDNNESGVGQFEIRDNADTVLFDVHDDGKVGVGTTSPIGAFHVNHPNSITDGGLAISNVASSNQWKFFASNTTALRLYYNNSYRGVFSSTSGAYTSTSDKNLKNNIKPIASLLDKVSKLEVMSYNFNDQTDNTKYIGLIAQDVEKVFPHLVIKPDSSDKENSHYTMDYSGFGVLAIKAIQEQQEKIESLENKVDLLLKRLESLENK